MTTRRERALGAAIVLLGTQGLSALTHRRVDAAAELPPGSTSNYFRTRDALLAGVVEAILQRDLAGVRPTLAPASVEELLDALVDLLDRTTREQRVLTTARLVLFMEASHDPVLREALGRGRTAIATALEPALRDLGAPDPAAGTATLLACLEGVILHRVARHDDGDVRAVLGTVLRGALA